MHAVVAFAKPFRMPDFFLISGLFLAQVIDRDWRTYLDRKVVHFVYFYLLWTAIQFAFKAPVFAHEHGGWARSGLYVDVVLEPFGTLWFIYLLPIFFVVTKLAHSLRIPSLVDLAGRRRARDRAHPHRLDRDRRVRRAASSISTPAICSRRASSRWRALARRRPRRARRALAAWGAGQRRAWCSHGFAGLAVRLARARPGRRRRGGARLGADGQERPVRVRCAIAARIRSSSTSRSSCRWRRAARCCSRPARSPTSAPCRSLVTVARRRRRAGACSGRCGNTSLRFLFERPERFWIAAKSPHARCSRRNKSASSRVQPRPRAGTDPRPGYPRVRSRRACHCISPDWPHSVPACAAAKSKHFQPPRTPHRHRPRPPG